MKFLKLKDLLRKPEPEVVWFEISDQGQIEEIIRRTLPFMDWAPRGKNLTRSR